MQAPAPPTPAPAPVPSIEPAPHNDPATVQQPTLLSKVQKRQKAAYEAASRVEAASRSPSPSALPLQLQTGQPRQRMHNELYAPQNDIMAGGSSIPVIPRRNSTGSTATQVWSPRAARRAGDESDHDVTSPPQLAVSRLHTWMALLPVPSVPRKTGMLDVPAMKSFCPAYNSLDILCRGFPVRCCGGSAEGDGLRDAATGETAAW